MQIYTYFFNKTSFSSFFCNICNNVCVLVFLLLVSFDIFRVLYSILSEKEC